MLTEIFKDIINELKFGYLKRKHPHKYCYLASISNDKPVSRTVVLRDMTENHHLIFYTDIRSAKVEQYRENPHAEALFYHPKKLLQVKVSGKMKIVDDEDTIKYYKQKVQGNSTKDYTTIRKPGTVISNPDEVDYGDHLNFAVMELQTESIESLQLKRPNHLRCIFKKSDYWKGEFLVP